MLAGSRFADEAPIRYAPTDHGMGSDDRRPHAIVGGVETSEGDWPWLVSLQNESGHQCGASLVAPDAVITAAHCVYGSAPADLTAVIGRHDLRTDSGEQHRVDQIVIHPNYDPYEYDYDIAVLLLRSGAVSPTLAYLHPDQTALTDPGRDATILGWGALREIGDIVDQLRQVTVPIVSNDVANLPISYDGQITANMLAAGLAEGGKDTCYGDSGGPLVVQDGDGHYYLAGVVSWGEGCARPNKYGINARVTAFASWIDSIVQVTKTGTVGFSRRRYQSSQVAEVHLQDADLSALPSTILEVSSDRGDRESVDLSSVTAGRFHGEVPLSNSDVQVGNGLLEVHDNEQIHVTYRDEDPGNGVLVELTDSARIIVDDYGNQPGSSSPLSLPASVNGELELADDEDWFQFQAADSKAYEIELRQNGTLNDSLLSVFDSDGSTRLTSDNSFGTGQGPRLMFVPNSAGTKYIRVSGRFSSVGTYNLRLTEIDLPADDHGNYGQVASQISIPSESSGDISFTSDVDWFDFDAVKDKVYRFRVDLDTLEDSQIRLIGSDGRSELAYDDDSGANLGSQIVWRAPSAGTYFLEVSSFESATGSYRLSASVIELAPDEHGNDAAQATRIDVPTTAQGEIGLDNDVDWFVFHAEAHTRYRIATSLATLDDSYLRVFASDGVTELAADDDNGSGNASRLVLYAREAADYHVEVSGFFQSVGQYSLSVEPFAVPLDDIGELPSTARPIDAPAAIESRIDFESDLDWFSFEAQAGRRYQIQAATNLLELDSYLRLFDSNGTALLAENDDGPDSVDSRIEWTAETAGTKYIEVSGYAGSQGPYTLSLDVDAANPVRIEVPSSTNGELVRSGDADWFVFAAVAGTVYRVETELETLPDSYLRLIDSDQQTQIAADDNSGAGQASRIIWQAETGGDHYLQVTGVNNQTGSYRVAITTTSDDHGNRSTSATPVDLPSTIDGHIEAGGDVDWFAIDVTAGRTYSFSTVLDTLRDSKLRLISTDGQTPIASDDDGGGGRASRIVWQADSTARVYIEVAGFRQNTGSYRLNVAVADDYANSAGNATSVAVPATVAGRLELADDVDWMRFQAQAGWAYMVEAQSNRPSIRIVGSDGTTVLAEANSETQDARIVWIAPTEGSYYVSIHSDAQTPGLDYELGIRVPYGDSNLDGRFDSADLISVFSQGEYEDDEVGNSSWQEGDWNGDGEFNTSDLVEAFAFARWIAEARAHRTIPPQSSRSKDTPKNLLLHGQQHLSRESI
jgi:hypothetical protein